MSFLQQGRYHEQTSFETRNGAGLSAKRYFVRRRVLPRVNTTGIFCRPSCQARKPHPEMWSFSPQPTTLSSPASVPANAAVRSSPMASLRNGSGSARTHRPEPCRPDHGRNAERDGYRSGTCAAVFPEHFGMNSRPTAAAEDWESHSSKSGAGQPGRCSAGYGYESHSGFARLFRTFGKAPGQSRDADCVLVAWMESPVGADRRSQLRGVCCWNSQTAECSMPSFRGASLLPVPDSPGDNEHLQLLRNELKAYFAGELKRFTVKLVSPGSTFQERVWGELKKIPYGSTVSYEDIACRIGMRPQCARGHANGLNRIAIVIPATRGEQEWKARRVWGRIVEEKTPAGSGAGREAV